MPTRRRSHHSIRATRSPCLADARRDARSRETIRLARNSGRPNHAGSFRVLPAHIFSSLPGAPGCYCGRQMGMADDTWYLRDEVEDTFSEWDENAPIAQFAEGSQPHP